MSDKSSPRTLVRILPYILIFTSLVGLLASFALTYDKLQILQNPDYEPSCSINPIFSCGSVMLSDQANLFGVPNTIFGLMAFTALLSFGVMLLAGATFRRWMWVLAELAALIGVLFMHYLFFQSAFRIMAICIWCFTVWMITIPIFWYLTVYNLQQKYIILPKQLVGVGKAIQRQHGTILIAWYAILFAILLVQFKYYWSTLL
jgi:uncharacterized membrane protein